MKKLLSQILQLIDAGRREGVVAFVLLFILASAGITDGQALTVLHNFGDPSVVGDGTFINGGLVLGPDGYFYGTSLDGGSANGGTVFRLSSTGKVVIVHNFGSSAFPNDGAGPSTALTLGTDGYLYGVTTLGGKPGIEGGVIFKVSTRGQYMILHTFNDGSVPQDGTDPHGGLVQGSDGNFYGTTKLGGSASGGTVYKMTPQGVVTILHNFPDSSVANDGKTPVGNLVEGSDGSFYGVTCAGGLESGTAGIIFKITPGGTYTVLHRFDDGTVTGDGSAPLAGLCLGPDGAFYGATQFGGNDPYDGTIYKITPQGLVTILHDFGYGSLGFYPASGLVLSPDGSFYGTTQRGGGSDTGTIYRMTSSGVVTFVHGFGDGSVPNDGDITTDEGTNLVVGSDGCLYGATGAGGLHHDGIAFKLDPKTPAMASVTTASATVGRSFSYYTTTAASSPPTTSYSAANLPAGLTINSVTGLISGIPVVSGSGNVSITLTNAYESATAQLQLTIAALPAPTVTSPLGAFGQVNTPFSYTIEASDHPTTFAATGLPNGLNFDSSTGIISGSPTATGTSSVTISATNATGTGTGALSLQISSTAPTLSQEYLQLEAFYNVGNGTEEFDVTSLIQGLDGSLYGTSLFGSGYSFFNMTNQGTYSPIASAGSIDYAFGALQAADGNFYVMSGSSGNVLTRVTPGGAILSTQNLDGDDAGAPIQGTDGNLYGTSPGGGIASEGYVYKLTPSGVVTVLHSFGDGSVTNDGTWPQDALVQGTDGNLYGITESGGSAGQGVVFKITSQGIYSIIHQFTYNQVSYVHGGLIEDGGRPVALIQAADGNLYGTTGTGGTGNGGNIFKMTTTGSETVLYEFNDNGQPESAGSLIQGYDGNFYGVSGNGGIASYGTVYEITSTGTVTVIHSFGTGSVPEEGLNPNSLTQGADGNFYGTCEDGGTFSSTTGFGSVFEIAAQQVPTHVPIFTGAAAQTTTLNSDFSYTPKAKFGTSGSVAITGNAVTQSQGIMGQLETMLPAFLQPATSSTNWTMTGTLPSGLSFNSTSGTISGTATPAGTYTLMLTPHNVVGAGTATAVTITINAPTVPLISSAATVTGSVNTLFNYQIAASGSPTAFDTAFLPTFFSVNKSTGAISGSPNVGGAYAFYVSASNAAGSATQLVTLTVSGGPASAPTINSATSTSGAAGTAFTYQISATQNPTGFGAFALPPGLLFDPTTGLIFGAPTTGGTYIVPITATNASGTRASYVILTVSHLAAPGLRANLAALGTPGTPFTYQIPATGVVTAYGATNLPTGLNIDTLTGIISGTPTTAGNTSVMVSAVNGAGTSTATLGLIIGTPVTQSYGSWVTQNSVSTGPASTPLNDAVPNLLKYLYNIHPGSTMTATDRAGLPVLGEDTTSNPGTNYLTLSYRKSSSATGVTVNLQASSDMQNWATVTPDINQPIGIDPNTGDPIMEVGVTMTGAGEQFIRMDVTSP